MKRYSILNNLRYCYFCGRPVQAIHEVYGGCNRQRSIQNGFCVGLCNYHHNMSDESVHFNRDMDLELKRLYQKKYEEDHTRDDFIDLIGKSFL